MDIDFSLDITFILKDIEVVMVFLEVKLREDNKIDEGLDIFSYNRDNFILLEFDVDIVSIISLVIGEIERKLI